MALLCVSTDLRTSDWLLMPSPWPSVAIVAAYLFVVHQGPKWMAKRQPFSLNNVLIVYNAALVALSIYMFWEVRRISIICLV